MKVDCAKCEKPTWKGCGKHIEQALKDVPEDERCKCPRDSPAPTATEVKKSEETKVEATSVSDETKKDSHVKSEGSKVETTAHTEETKSKAD